MLSLHRGNEPASSGCGLRYVGTAARANALTIQGDALMALAEVLHLAGRGNAALRAAEEALERRLRLRGTDTPRTVCRRPLRR